MMLREFRRGKGLVNLVREPLRGKVDVEETSVWGIQAGLRGDRQLRG